MKNWIVALAAPLALLGQPLAAQEPSEDEAAAIAAITSAFAVEPLTAEQESRLPLAQKVVEKMLPEGAMAQVMGSMFDGMLGPFAKLAEAAGPDLEDQIGYASGELELSDEQAVEIAAIIDPQWKERQKREMDMMQAAMGKIMSAMEPGMRKGMTEAYAVNFSVRELTDLDAFFATETGAAFAQKSYAMANDPRIVSATMAEFPSMMEEFAGMEADMKAAAADLPQKKTFETLTPEQKARILELTGLTEEDLQFGMESASDAEAAANAAADAAVDASEDIAAESDASE